MTLIEKKATNSRDSSQNDIIASELLMISKKKLLNEKGTNMRN